MQQNIRCDMALLRLQHAAAAVRSHATHGVAAPVVQHEESSEAASQAQQHRVYGLSLRLHYRLSNRW